MRRYPNTPPPPPGQSSSKTRGDIATLKTLLPYLWVYKWRVLAALLALVGAKAANVGVPVVLKKLVDDMTIKPGDPHALLVLPLATLVAYGLLRLSTTSRSARCAPLR
jgi:ATP-binding cassette subfamily B protein